MECLIAFFAGVGFTVCALAVVGCVAIATNAVMNSFFGEK